MKKVHETKITPRYAETDQMGLIHHSAYVVYLEQARIEYLESIGLAYHELEQYGQD